MELVRLYGVGGLAGAVNPANLKTHLGVFLMKLASVPASNAKMILLSDGITGISIAMLEGHSSSITFMMSSADSSKLASASEDGTVRLWDTGGAGRCIAIFAGHSRFITSIAISTDVSRLASASDDTTVQLWDSRAGIRVVSLLGPHTDK